MPTFPSRQFYLSQIIGTGTQSDPFRPAVWNQAAGDRACVHVFNRVAWQPGQTPTASALVRAMVTQTEHQTIIADSHNDWLGVGEDVIAQTLTNTQIDAINTLGLKHLTGWSNLAHGLTVIGVLESVAGQFALLVPPGGTHWGY